MKSSWKRLARRTVSVGGPVGLLVALGSSLSWGVEAQGSGRVCGTQTLRGDYALVGSGVRGLPSGVSETFTTISMVTYDGQGTFTAVGVSHGATTGVREGPVRVPTT